jgi:transcriptional regulator with XRE-family HTH domain
MAEQSESQRHPIIHNRIHHVLEHISWYSVRGQERLAQDAGVSASAVSRLINGHSNPTFSVVWRISKALERRIGMPVDPKELISIDGTYPTPSVHTLLNTPACDLEPRQRLQAAAHQTNDPTNGGGKTKLQLDRSNALPAQEAS